MTEPTDAEIDALWVGQQLTVPQIVQRRVIARAALAKWGTPAPVGVEPVAWAFKYDDGTWHAPSTTEHSSGMRPLFAAPQPVVREPLTDEWIRSRCKEPWVFETAKQWVRMAEAAHGINKGGGEC